MAPLSAPAWALASLIVPTAGLGQLSTLNVQTAANPIRKVVTLLQTMQKRVAEEGEKEKKLYDEFMCYCKTGGKDLSDSIAAAEAKLGELATDIEETSSKLTKTQEDLKQAKTDRAAAEKAMAEATALREKEAAAFAIFKDESNTNIAAVAKAVAALERGMGAGFLQTSSAGVLRGVVSKAHNLDDDDRKLITAFLSGPSWGGGYAAQSGQITGILKTMGDEMSASLAEATTTEEAAIQAHSELMDTRKKERQALTEAIEAKLEKEGELGVSLAEMKNDQVDTTEALAADQKFQANLQKGCATKTAEWEARSKTRSEELVALADTIQILNNDDALELFKKTLPSASASFVQVQVSQSSRQARALESLRKASQTVSAPNRVQLDLISLALHGEKIGFDKVIAMIDKMVATLKKEQTDDDTKKAYCNTQIDETDDKKKSLERKISQLDTSVATAKESIATQTSDIAALKAGIAELDKSVAEATRNRKAEHDEYNELIASDSAAKEVLGFAKNRLNQFYNPKLAKGAKLVQISQHAQNQEAPAPPPETWGAYKGKSNENGSVISMINVLIGDLDKEMAAAEAEEKDAQADYETLMTDSADKRSADSKSLSEKEGAKADTEAALEKHTDDKAAASRDLGGTMKYMHSLHTECDWLLKYFDARAEARGSEIDALKNAKAVLSGSDYSF